MRKIVIGFSKSKKKFPIGSWLIRCFQGCTQYSHVYVRLLVKPRFPSDKILHAAEAEVNHWSETNFHKRNETVEDFLIDVPDGLYEELKDNIFHEKAGEKYGIMQNIGIVLVRILRLFGKDIQNPWQEGWNCSEFVWTVLNLIFPEEVAHLKPNTVTPKDINIVLNRLKSDGKINNYSI